MPGFALLLVVLVGCEWSSPLGEGQNLEAGGDSDGCTPSLWYADADGDGYGDPAAATVACDAPEGSLADGSDCDDTREDVYPGAEELCADGVANDCDDTDGSAAREFCSGTGPFPLSGADAHLLGVTPEELAGLYAAGAGDVNGDGHDDLLVGTDPDSGAVQVAYLVSGPVEGDRSLATSDAVIVAEGEVTGLIPSRDLVGDVDGDGYADLMMGAPGMDRAYLVPGPVSGELDAADVDSRVQGLPGDWTGYALASLGDTDGDGLSEIIVGARGAQGSMDPDDEEGCSDDPDYSYWPGYEAGAVYLITAPAEGIADVRDALARLVGDGRCAYLGDEVSAAGDLDGDGLMDLAATAPGQEGRGSSAAVYVVLSPLVGEVGVADADARVRITMDHDNYEMGVASAGDTDGDGAPDLMITDPTHDVGSSADWAGRVYLFLRPLEGTTNVGDAVATLEGASSSWAGASVAGPGDLDADGYDDLVIGAGAGTYGTDPPGAAFVLYGPVYGTRALFDDADIRFSGDAPYDDAGGRVAGAGDMDGDGLPDVLVGAPGHDVDGEKDAGAAYLLLGAGALLSGTGRI